MNDAILPVLFSAAVILSLARVAWWQARAPAGLRARGWRLTLLALLQPICAALLYFTLVPPAETGSAATLVVATARAPRATASAANIVALPEAPPIAGAERVPDLATALRRHPGTTRVRIVGEGLEPRDRDAARGLALAFDTPRAPRGLIGLALPLPTAPGAAFRIGGRVSGVPAGRIELLDPAGVRVDLRPLGADGSFIVTGTARVSGVALVRVRVRDSGGGVVEEVDVPIRTTDDSQPRLLVLAGAATPEVKYLRRWATDAGLGVTTQITAGGGMTLGDAPVPIDAGTLARFDAAIVDERSWAGLGTGQRAVLIGAVRGGMGLVVRLTGPVPDATRRQWQGMGLAIGNGVATAPAPLANGVPILTRRILRPSPAAVPIWRDARGAVLADWRAATRGRVALWAVDDAFALVLSGNAERYGAAWGATLAAVSRSRSANAPGVPPLPRAGERMAICASGTGARVAFPADAVALSIDPASGGCAGYWPRRPGWHSLIARGISHPFYVYPPDGLLHVRAQKRMDATAALRRTSAPATTVTVPTRGPSWPWFLAFLVAATVTWWFERARFGRRAIPAPAFGANSA